MAGFFEFSLMRVLAYERVITPVDSTHKVVRMAIEQVKSRYLERLIRKYEGSRAGAN